jgi:hypothetical protein
MSVATAMMTFAFGASMNVPRIQFWAAAGAVFGAFLFMRGFQMLRAKRLILNTPESKIRSASMGLVEISGTASGPKTIPAGISGDPCYCYRAMAWQLRQSGNNREWMKVADECVYVPFFVEDSTGRVLVDPAGAELDIHRNFKDEFGDSLFSNRDIMHTNMGGFLMRNGLVNFDTTRLEEFCIKPNHPLFVLGTLGKNSERGQWLPVVQKMSGPSFKSQLNLFGPASKLGLQVLGVSIGIAPQYSTIQASALPVSDAATVSAKPAAPPASARWSAVSIDDDVVGAVRDHAAPSSVATQVAPAVATQPSPLAATALAAVAALTTAAPAAASNGFDLNCSTKVAKGTDGEPFVISWQSQRDVVQSLAWRSAVCIWGGPILSLACAYILLLSLGWL